MEVQPGKGSEGVAGLNRAELVFTFGANQAQIMVKVAVMDQPFCSPLVIDQGSAQVAEAIVGVADIIGQTRACLAAVDLLVTEQGLVLEVLGCILVSFVTGLV